MRQVNDSVVSALLRPAQAHAVEESACDAEAGVGSSCEVGGMARWRAVPTYHSPSVRGVCDTQTALYGDFLYMLGVFSYDCNATWKFDVGESRWSEVARHQPRCRTTSPAAVYSERMYIFGGRSGDAFSQNVDAFDFKTERWSEVMTGGARPSARDGCARAVSREGVLFVFGGLGCSGVLGDMYELNLDTLVWTATDQQGSVPSAREGASWVRHRNCIYLFGGWDGEKYFGDFFCFEISSRSWSWVETCPRPALPLTDSDPSPSPGVAAAAEKAWPEAPESVAGSAGSAETSVISGAPSPRYRHAAVAHRHCLYIFGGCGGEGLLNDLYVFNFDAHRWHAVRCSDVPSPRMPMGAHVYKNTLYTVGGNSTYCGVPDVFQCDLEGVLVPPSAFMTVLNSFLAPPYSDVTFVVEGEKRLYGCKAILMARSEHFRAMFNSEMREKKLAGGGQPIRIGDISYR
ncbi:leucine zipper-like transcriptional regulator, partial [Cystoisospora suis]